MYIHMYIYIYPQRVRGDREAGDEQDVHPDLWLLVLVLVVISININ